MKNLVNQLLTEQFSLYYQVRAPIVYKMLALEEKDKVLEIGCHQGAWSVKLGEKAKILVGVDINFWDLSQARKNVFSQGCGNVSLVLASAEFLPFKNASFNKVLGVDVIEHIFDDKKAVLETSRVLKPKGRFVLTTLKEVRRHYLKRIVFEDHIREYSWSKLEAIFAGSGLKIKEKAEFYRFFSTIAWEIRGLFFKYRVVPHLLAPFLVILSKLDFFLPSSEGRGMALMVEKR